jgi:serine kinase of HPr protein (carbohydrate metabolism regulator)
MLSCQATCVAIRGKALLIQGPAGSGKSSLALALIDRGAMLIGDDSVLISADDWRLFAFCHPATRGLLEVRNLGLLTFPVCESAPIALVIQLEDTAPRYIEEPGSAMLAGISIPMVRIWPSSPVLHLKAELALRNFGLPD